MAKNFKTNALDGLMGKSSKDIQSSSTKKKNNKTGRPQEIDYPRKAISIKIDLRLLEKWEEIKKVHGSNLTQYIEKLVKKDMDENYSHYKELSNSLNNL